MWIELDVMEGKGDGEVNQRREGGGDGIGEMIEEEDAMFPCHPTQILPLIIHPDMSTHVPTTTRVPATTCTLVSPYRVIVPHGFHTTTLHFIGSLTKHFPSH